MIDRTIRYRAVVHYERFYKSLRGVAQIYSVSKSSLQRWVTMKPSIRKPRRPKQILREIRDCIDAALAATPCMTVQQICSTVASKCSLRRSSTNTTRKWLKDLKYSRKKVYKTVEYTPSEGLTSEFINTYSTSFESTKQAFMLVITAATDTPSADEGSTSHHHVP